MHVKRFVLVAAASTALCAAVSSTALARSKGGFSGRSLPADAGTCFTESYGRATYNCAGTGTWETALEIESSGYWDVAISVTTTSNATGVSCEAYGISQDGATYWNSPTVASVTASAVQTIPLVVYAPSGGFMYAACFLNQGASVNSTNWIQPLQVSEFSQQQSNWCWDASGQMIMTYLGTATSQCADANTAEGRTDCCTNAASASNGSECNQGGWPLFSQHNFTYSSTTGNTALSFASLQTEIAANRPVGFSWHWNGGGGHYMVVTGTQVYSGNEFVDINDPWSPNVGETVTITYSEFVSGTSSTDGTTAGSGGYTHWRDDYNIVKSN